MSKRGYTLITGGAGFIGSNLADAILSEGGRVVIVDDLSRDGVWSNAEWLEQQHGNLLEVRVADIRDREQIVSLVQEADAVYHLAAQVAVTTSVEDPVLDLQVNLLGTFNILEAARAMHSPPPILFTSTNKVYGALAGGRVEKAGARYRYADGRAGISEADPLDFHSPYGCSKGAADQYVRDYARIYGLPTVVFRMSCIYGTRQFGTEDQGWVAHFARSVLSGAPITVFGDGHQVRDLLWIGDLVAAMREAMRRIDSVAGEVFNIGGGAGSAVTVRQVIDQLIEITGERVPVQVAPWRPGDQRIYVSDVARARQALGWEPTTDWQSGLARLVEWLEEADLATPLLPLATAHAAPPLMARAAL